MRTAQRFATIAVALVLSATGLGALSSTREAVGSGLAPSTSSGLVAASAPLADAAEKIDRARVRALLAQRVDVNAPQADGMTALHWAIYHDDREMAGQLLSAGASVKAVNRYGVTPLALACTNGSAVLVGMLLTAGADPNAPLPGGETPLMTAARTGALALGEEPAVGWRER